MRAPVLRSGPYVINPRMTRGFPVDAMRGILADVSSLDDDN